jgi:YVTN family beta-propeller protein
MPCLEIPVTRRVGWRSRCGALAAAAVALLTTLPVSSTAQSAQGGRTGTLVVLNKGESTATFIDLASGETLATLPTGQGPHELAITRDGRWAVSTDYSGGNSLTVFDVANLRVARTIDLGANPRPHGALFLPGDSVLAISSEASRTVVLVNPFRGAVIETIETEAGGSHMVAVTGDGGTIYTGDMQANTVSQLDVGTATKTRSFDVPTTPEAITVSMDGREVWVGSNGEGLVSIVDTERGSVESPLSGFDWPYRILIVENRNVVVIPDLGQHVVRFVDFETRSVIDRIELPGEGPQGMAVTPDGGTLFLSLSQSGQIAVIDLESRRIVRRLDSGPTPDGVGWSPLVIR